MATTAMEIDRRGRRRRGRRGGHRGRVGRAAVVGTGSGIGLERGGIGVGKLHRSFRFLAVLVGDGWTGYIRSAGSAATLPDSTSRAGQRMR